MERYTLIQDLPDGSVVVEVHPGRGTLTTAEDGQIGRRGIRLRPGTDYTFAKRLLDDVAQRRTALGGELLGILEEAVG